MANQNDSENVLTNESLWSKLTRTKGLMVPYRLRWDRCSAYLRGDQLLSYTTGRDDLTPVDARRRKGRVIVNQLLVPYRKVCAQLCTEYPQVDVFGATDSADDMLKAKASEQFLRFFWHQANIPDVLGENSENLVCWGTSALRTRWNPQDNKVEVQCIRPYDLRFEPYVTDPSQSKWIGVVTNATMDELCEAYPEHADKLREYATPSQRYYAVGPQSMPDDRYELIDVYYRGGKHEVWANGIKLFTTQCPGDRLPVQVVRFTVIRGYVWGLSMLEPMLDPQDLYNASRTQILANAKLIGNPKITVPVEGNISPKAFTDQPGEKILFAEGMSPQYLSPPPLPQYLVDQPAQILSEMYDISGIHGTSLGKKTQGLNSGVAIQATVQQDESQLVLTQSYIEKAVREMAIDVLCYAKAYLTSPTRMRIQDRSSKVLSLTISATDLVDEPEIFLQASSLFRSQIEDIENKAIQLFQMGAITKDQLDKALKYHVDPLNLTEQVTGLRHAQEVLEAVAATGYPAQVFPSDDLNSMLDVVGSFVRSAEFYSLAPDKQQAVINLLNAINAAKNPPAPGMLPPPGTPPGMLTPPMSDAPGSAQMGLGAPNPPPAPTQQIDNTAQRMDNAATTAGYVPQGAR